MTKIIIEETKEVREIGIIDAASGLDWSMDFIGNNIVSPRYEYSEKEDDDLMVMSQEDFDWWETLANEWEKADEAKKDFFDNIEMKDEVDPWEVGALLEEMRDCYETNNIFGCELENHPAAMLEAIEDVKEKYKEYLK
jgi:hypothetical protein